MKRTLITIFALIIISLSLFGCTRTQCKQPYVLINDVCCTDENSNQVCDIEELPSEEEAKEEKEEKYRMAEPVYEDTGMDLPEPTYEEPENTAPAAVAPTPAAGDKRYIDQDYPEEETSAEPAIDNTYDVKKGDEYVGMKPAVVTPSTPALDFKVSNIKWGYGKLNRVDVEVTNHLDIQVDPRVHVLVPKTDKYGNVEYIKVQDLYLKTMWPGKTRLFEDEFVNADIGHDDQVIKFEFAYYLSRVGLTKVGEQDVFLEGR
ncbi:TPA: hypothetical protein HA265_01600 [Candidatus Woesearchaeota archaeon]|nr:hypothetical protein [Candidatus Woesearchaeota archaeon]